MTKVTKKSFLVTKVTKKLFGHKSNKEKLFGYKSNTIAHLNKSNGLLLYSLSRNYQISTFLISHVADSELEQRYLNATRALALRAAAGNVSSPDDT